MRRELKAPGVGPQAAVPGQASGLSPLGLDQP